MIHNQCTYIGPDIERKVPEFRDKVLVVIVDVELVLSIENFESLSIQIQAYKEELKWELLVWMKLSVWLSSVSRSPAMEVGKGLLDATLR